LFVNRRKASSQEQPVHQRDRRSEKESVSGTFVDLQGKGYWRRRMLMLTSSRYLLSCVVLLWAAAPSQACSSSEHDSSKCTDGGLSSCCSKSNDGRCQEGYTPFDTGDNGLDCLPPLEYYRCCPCMSSSPLPSDAGLLCVVPTLPSCSRCRWITHAPPN
jgi:hypothetical protein